MPYSFGENRQGRTYFAVACVFQGIAVLAIAARLWSKRIVRLSLQLNDFAILIALVRHFGSILLLATNTVTTGAVVSQPRRARRM